VVIFVGISRTEINGRGVGTGKIKRENKKINQRKKFLIKKLKVEAPL